MKLPNERTCGDRLVRFLIANGPTESRDCVNRMMELGFKRHYVNEVCTNLREDGVLKEGEQVCELTLAAKIKLQAPTEPYIGKVAEFRKVDLLNRPAIKPTYLQRQSFREGQDDYKQWPSKQL